MQWDATQEAMWGEVGTGLSHKIFDRFERFEDALGDVLGQFDAVRMADLRALLEGMLKSEEDARELWTRSGAGIAFNDAKGARMGLLMVLEAVKARAEGLK